MGILDIVPAGVITGDNVRKVFAYASKHGFAIPAINCTSSSTINAALGKLSFSCSPALRCTAATSLLWFSRAINLLTRVLANLCVCMVVF
jgi:fructose/tagatose bisphosphate aldolase